MSISDLIMNQAIRLCETLATDRLVNVALVYAKREPNHGQESIMDAISLVLAKRLDYEDFREVMILINEAVDNDGRNFHKGDTKQGD